MCAVVFSGFDKDWFAMGRRFLSEPDFNFVKVLRPLGHAQNETHLPTTIVEDQDIVFPAGHLTWHNLSGVLRG